MEKKELFTSGLLERYILGDTSPQEAAMVESWIAKDDDIKAQFQTLEEDFERLAQENAIAPPSYVKEELMASVAAPATNAKNKWYLGVAAALVLFMGLSSYFQYMKMQKIEHPIKE